MRTLIVAAFGSAFSRYVRKWIIRLISFATIVVGVGAAYMKFAYGWGPFLTVTGLLLFALMLQPAVNRNKSRPKHG